MITLVYLARLRESLGLRSEVVELPPQIRNVAGLLSWLRGRGDTWAAELAPGRAVRVAVNLDMAKADTPVRAGDEIAFFPPVTGG
ncbi:MAG TPA: molybdopterin converting factor subunit 1 [Casimicrobiaceae bacterium]|nr:molybdopterin converting factor subunit 1 [Casimicrobiaceae bacterium]